MGTRITRMSTPRWWGIEWKKFQPPFKLLYKSSNVCLVSGMLLCTDAVRLLSANSIKFNQSSDILVTVDLEKEKLRYDTRKNSKVVGWTTIKTDSTETTKFLNFHSISIQTSEPGIVVTVLNKVAEDNIVPDSVSSLNLIF